MDNQIAQARPLEAITQEIISYKSIAVASFLEIGKRLIEAKEQLAHGTWETWLRDRVDFSEGQAQKYMRLSRQYAPGSAAAQLGFSKALALLAVPEDEREEFITQTHTVDGQEKTVADMTKSELEAAIRRRNEALDEVESLKALSAAQEEDLTYQKSRVEAMRTTTQELTDRVESLQAALDEEKARPIEVASEPTPEQVAAIRQAAAKEAWAQGKQTAEASMTEKLQAAQAQLDAAQAAKAEAEAKLAQLEQDTARAAATAAQAAARQQALERDLAAAKRVASPGMAAFRAQFEVAKGAFVAMQTLIRQEQDMEAAGKMRNGLTALLSSMQQQVVA